MSAMDQQLPPNFFLYGEAAQAADPDFIHVEDLAIRSKPHDWQIAPHKHADLCHLILITKGGGTIQYESEFIEFLAPNLLVVPAGRVHGFNWTKQSAGSVLTIAEQQLVQVIAQYGELSQLFAQPRSVPMDAAECASIAATMEGMSRELSWISLGQSAALQAGLLSVMVRATRQLQQFQSAPETAAEPTSQTQRNLVARFRQLLEQRYRQREPVEIYARELGVSLTSLREACAAQGQSPVTMRDGRAILEAQRLLAFSAMSVTEVGETIGIADPAYFSRFFTRKCDVSPAQWRRQLKQRKGAGN